MSELYERDAKSVSCLAHLRFSPLAVVGGKGAYLKSDDGRDLLDFSASWGAANLGHADPYLRRAVDEAFANQAGASYLSGANLPSVELAEKLLSVAPKRAAGKVWFGHSGSDANETAARVIVAATGRERILAFNGAYHGGTLGSMAISGHPSQQGARSEKLASIPYPNVYADGERAAESVLAHLDHLFETSLPPEEVAAFFIESIQSDGGMIVPPAGFFKEIESRCRRHGILLVADEVKVGLGRTGRFHGFEHCDIDPDVVIFGKGLGGGLPISAIVGPDHIMSHAVAFSLQTLHGNPICAAAASAVLHQLQQRALVENAKETGAHLLCLLEDLKARQGAIGDVRGRGLAIGVELVAAGEISAREMTAMVVFRALELGLVIYYVGVNSNVLELTPPLTLTQDEARHGVAILEQAIQDVVRGKVDIAAVARFSGW